MLKSGKVWGMTSLLFNRNDVELHFIEVKAGGFCSTHSHCSKFNRFFVIDGRLQIEEQKPNMPKPDVTVLGPGDDCIIPPGNPHRFRAETDVRALEIYWVELDPHDIQRKDVGGCETKD